MLNSIIPRDYNGRLHNSVVCYDGFPVILQVVSEHEFSLSPVHPKSKFKPKSINPTDMKLDISTPDLGYFNVQHGAVYIERNPVRRWRQGLCSTNCTVHLLAGESHTRRREDITGYVYTEGFEDLIQGRFPAIPAAIRDIKAKKVNSVALTRNVALSLKDDIINVWYKKDKVGYIPPNEMKVKVPSEPMAYIVSKFLRELPWVVD